MITTEVQVKKPFGIKYTDKETLLKWYYLLALGRKIDDKAPNYLKQALGWSYHAPYAGHDAIQMALGQVFVPSLDHLFPYYRDMQVAISAGLTAEEIILNGISKATDIASGGRHMSNHFAKPAWNIHNVSSATGNHALHAVGVARAIKKYGSKAVSFCSMGESATSEGYVYEAINGASNEKLPVVFVIQDNNYGISVPKRDQTANWRSSANFTGFKNLKIMYCDGKNVFASMNTMTEARKYATENMIPVIVHASVVRIHSHSNSDKHELYRDDNERHCALASDPVDRYRKTLVISGRVTEEELAEIDKTVKDEVSKAHKKAIVASDPDPASIFNFVLPEAYQPKKYPNGTHDDKSGEKLKLIQALNQTLKAEFRHNPDTFLWGQDIANKEKGGIFNVSKGMQQEFGIERVFNAPIA